jgi:hypothetical protein
MKETLSVEKAIKIGKKRVHIPTYMFLFFGFLITFSFTTNLFTEKSILKVEFIPIGFLLTIIFTVFFGNKLISKWKLWAFKNVRNVHELKNRAIQENLLYPNSSFMEKMEFKSSTEEKKWNEIQLKFKQEDIITENKKLNKEIKIYYSVRKTLYKSIGYLIMTCFLFFLAIENEFSFFIIAFTLGGFLLFISKVRKLINRKPQLTINEKGIKEGTNNLLKWKNINNEQIIANANKSELFLIYENKEILINIKDFEINKSNLKEIIETNRIRNKSTTANTVYN